MKRVLEMTRAYSQMHRADNYSEDSLTIYPVWPNRWVFIYKLSDSGFESSCCHSQSFADFAAASSKEFLDIQKTAECGFTLKRLVTWHKPIVKFNVQISTHNTAQSFGQFSQMVECFLQTKSFWVRVQLTFKFRACFGQGVPWHPRNYRVWIHSETRTWHDKNIQSNSPFMNKTISR